MEGNEAWETMHPNESILREDDTASGFEELGREESREDFLSNSNDMPLLEDASSMEDIQMTPAALLSTEDLNAGVSLNNLGLNSQMESSGSIPPPLPEIDYLPKVKDKALEWTPLEEGLEADVDGTFFWKIKDWSKLPPHEKQLSPEYRLGDFIWRAMLFPKGAEESSRARQVALYMGATPADPAAGNDWHVCARIILAMQNPEDPAVLVAKNSQHRFDTNEADWGFINFVSNRAMGHGDSSHGPLLHDDSVTVIFKVQIIKDPTDYLWHNFLNYNSKKATGCVGLQNQGATCYMNSLLQSLFMTNLLRKATYKIPTENDNPNDSIPLALQRVFYRLQTSDSPVGTTELTKSFGWDSMESFMQHDVHEFNRVLMDELENKMKKTEVEGMVEKIFTGKVKHVRKCLNVSFESNREETFYDVQLTIKGVKSLEESFKLYVKPEMLDGENKYRTDEFGLQDAKMYCIFEKFPPVLHLHLERYTFDPNTFNTIKINDYFEFPERINLDKFLSETADKSVPQDFVLHSVLVHGGDSHGGHYNVFINRDGKWYKFDDTRVVQVTKREAIQDNYGYTEDNDVIEMDSSPVYPKLPSYNRLQRYRKMTNAYMLVYIREADWDLIMSPVTDVDIPEYISKRIKADEEAELRRRLERQETMMAVHVSLFTDEELQKYCGPDFFNLQKKAFPITGYESLRMRRDNTIAEVKDIIAEEMGLQPGSFRLWSFAVRRNGTTRLDVPLESDEKSLYTYTGTGQLSNQVFLYLERAKLCDENETPIFPENSPGTAFVTFKYFNRDTGTLHHLTSMTVTKDNPIEPYVRQLCDDFGLMDNSFPFEVFEEIKLMRLDSVVPSKTFDACSIGTGDILLIQRAAMVDEVLPSVIDYFADMADSVLLVLKPMDETVGRKRSSDDIPIDENVEEIEFVYKTKGPLSYVLDLIGQKINVDPKYIRLHWLDPRTERYWTLKNLSTEDISVEKAIEAAVYPATQALNVHSKLVFSFEVLSMAVEELDSMKHITVHLSGFKDVDINEKHDLYVPFHANLRDLSELLPDSVQAHLSDGDSYRLFEVGSHRITRDYGMDDLLASIPDGNSVYLQKIEPLGEGDLIVGCFFYHRDPVRTHSMPFIFVLRADEPFWETKRRLQEFLGADTGLKVSIIAFGRPKDIEETQALSDILDVVSGSKRVVYHQSIGIDIPDPSQEEAIQKAKSVGSERSIKIRSSTPSNQK